MYIQPNSTIKILKDCPLDNTYDHTIYFTDSNAQYSYFNSLVKFTLNNQTYQRVNKGSMRVGIKAESLYDCNYLMFQNTSFGNKWFYAFIKTVEYINNEVSEITFEIDVMQTWNFDYTLLQNFVEREHSVTDNFGENTVPENVELGEYIADEVTGTTHGIADTIVIAATFRKNSDGEYVDYTGGRYGGTYSGLYYTIFRPSSTYVSDCNDWIDGAVDAGKGDGIVAIFQMPDDFVTMSGVDPCDYTVTKTYSTTRMGASGYTPRNKKLLTYPYNFMYVSNLQGTAATFFYERLNNPSSGQFDFWLGGDMSVNPGLILTPKNYKGITGNNYDEKMVLTGFPQCSWNTDTFKAWVAQTGASTIVANLSSAAGIGVGAMLGTGVAAGAAGALGVSIGAGATIAALPIVAGTLAKAYEHYIQPNQAHGSPGSTTLNSFGLLDFIFMKKHITDEYATIIDGFFDMYGYATHRVKVPNRSSRPHWNYVKTVGCKISGSCPADDESKICSIYDKGITFWKDGSEIGNYSLDNRPVTG